MISLNSNLFAFFGGLRYVLWISSPYSVILSVDSFILIDANTGTVLAENNSSMKIEPASLEDMTTYVAAHAIKAGHANLEDKVVSESVEDGRFEDVHRVDSKSLSIHY